MFKQFYVCIKFYIFKNVFNKYSLIFNNFVKYKKTQLLLLIILKFVNIIYNLINTNIPYPDKKLKEIYLQHEIFKYFINKITKYNETN